jgi:primase-like protein
VSSRGTSKPARVDVIATGVPERLRKLMRWVVWRWKRRKKNWDKPPLQLDGSFASVDDPRTWMTFDEALAAHRSGKFDGIGFVLGYVAEEDVTYTGVDLDDCRDQQTGELSDWAAAHLERLHTYAEVSPSGEGVKALALGKLPGPDRNESERLGVEMYSGNRYFTVTGHVQPGTPTEIGERTAALAELSYQLFGRPTEEKHCAGKVRLEDRELALSALGGLNSSLAVGYWDWLRVGMALHSVGADGQMLEAWETWSSQCPEKYQPGACEQKWQSFGKKGGLAIGSLIYWARENGWEFPRAEREAESIGPADEAVLKRLDEVLSEGAEAFFHDKELLNALALLAETCRRLFSWWNRCLCCSHVC